MVNGNSDPFCSKSQNYVMSPKVLEIFKENSLVDQLDVCSVSTIANYVDNYIKNSQLSNPNCSSFQNYTCNVCFYLFILYSPSLAILYELPISISNSSMFHLHNFNESLFQFEFLQLYSRHGTSFSLSIEWVSNE